MYDGVWVVLATVVAATGLYNGFIAMMVMRCQAKVSALEEMVRRSSKS